MHLVIQAHTLKNEPLSQPITGRFDERGGTIGRSDTNTLALPDPERHISRLHAEVSFSAGAFSIRNVGSANPISVNGRPIAPGQSSPLNNGDEVAVGAYLMRALLAPASATTAPVADAVDSRTVIKASASEVKTVPPASEATFSGIAPMGAQAMPLPAPAAAPAGSSADPFADLLGHAPAASAADPFADLMAPAPAARPTAAAVKHEPPPTVLNMPTAAPAASAAPARLPDDFDPFADISPPAHKTPLAAFAQEPAAAAIRPSAPGASSPFDDLLGPGASAPGGSSLDKLFGLGAAPAPGADPLATFMSAPAAPAAAGASLDPMALFGVAPAPGPAIPADFNHTPELRSAYRPPAVQPDAGTVPSFKPMASPDEATPLPKRAAPPAAAVRPSASQAAAPSATTAPASPGDADALWAAFCDGAGIQMQLPQGLNPEMMRILGQVLRHSIEGTLKLVQVRAAAKQELRAQVTTIQSRNNNPLKFSPDAGAAIEQLLQPPMRGFMMGPAAVNDVMDDLLGHAIGTMAGMRAALEGVLQRFEPGQLESKLVGGGMLDTVLPMNRRAKLWELYLQHFKRIQGDAEEDFHELFGKAFIRAYEDQLDRLDQSRHPHV